MPDMLPALCCILQQAPNFWFFSIGCLQSFTIVSEWPTIGVKFNRIMVLHHASEAKSWVVSRGVKVAALSCNDVAMHQVHNLIALTVIKAGPFCTLGSPNLNG